jgi:hypothetical protein
MSTPATAAIVLKPSFFLSTNNGIPPDFAQHLLRTYLLLNTALPMNMRLACSL